MGLALLLAATSSQFIICSWDPFVGFFRRNGPIDMLVIGGGLLLASMFVGRVYCRFLCPYGVLLRLTSRLSQWKVHISPAQCVDCRLCTNACPYGAILTPAASADGAPATTPRRWAILGVAVLVLLGIGSGYAARNVLAGMNDTVRVARTLRAALDVAPVATTLPGAALSELDERVKVVQDRGGAAEVLADAAAITRRFGVGGAILGAWLALSVGLRLLAWLRPARQRRANAYDADPAGCLACARCFKHCPVERQRLGQILPAEPAAVPLTVSVARPAPEGHA
jgi:NAD-dependent dihydropyrimidine dehydrogenase PreA subunit